MKHVFSLLPCGIGRWINMQSPSWHSCNGRIACLPLFHGLKEVSGSLWRLSGLLIALMLALSKGCFSDWMMGGLYHEWFPMWYKGGSFEKLAFLLFGYFQYNILQFFGN